MELRFLPPPTDVVTPTDGEPTATSNDSSEPETSRTTNTIPVQSSTNGGCSLSRTSPVTESGGRVAFGMALALSLAALARRRR